MIDMKPIALLKSLTNLTSLEIGLQFLFSWYINRGNGLVDYQPIAELTSLTNLTSLKI